jgi:hypothetical protein
MNYQSLFETVKGYVENDFPNTQFTDVSGLGTITFTSTEQINTFIKQAEQRIYNAVEVLASRAATTGNLTAGNKFLTVPSGWLATLSFAVVNSSGRYEYLLNKDVDFIRAAYPDPTYQALPVHYAHFDEDQFLLGPTPNSNYAYELFYYKYPESIVTANNTWLGDNFDTVLLYGTLLEAYTFMKGEPDMIELYNGRYQEALTQLKELAEGKNRQDAYRSGRLRLPVR